MRVVDKYIEIHEGRKHVRYFDKYGHKTIGIGFNLERPDARAQIEGLKLSYEDVCAGKVVLTDKQINILYYCDYHHAVLAAQRFCPTFNSLRPMRQLVLIDMAFNLGFARLAKFKCLHDALAQKNWSWAADEIKDSKWYKKDVGIRGKDDEYAMRHAEMPPRLVNMHSQNRQVQQLLPTSLWSRERAQSLPHITPPPVIDPVFSTEKTWR